MCLGTDDEFHEMYTYGEFGAHEEDEYFELSELNVRVTGVVIEGTQVLVTDQSTGTEGAAIHIYKSDGSRPSSEISAHDLTKPRNIAHLFGRTYILDVGTVQADAVVDDDSAIRAFSGTIRDEDHDIVDYPATVSIGAIRRFGGWPTSVMKGQPYLIESDRIQYNTDKLETLRLPGMTTADLSKAGIYAVDKDGEAYTAPVSYNGRVTFNSSQNVTPVHGQTIQEVLERLLANPSFLAGIKTKIEESGGKLDISKQILENDYDITSASFKIKKADNTNILRAYTKDSTGSRVRQPGDED